MTANAEARFPGNNQLAGWQRLELHSHTIGVNAIKLNFVSLVVAVFVLVIGFLAVGMMTGSGDLTVIEPSKQQQREAAIFRLNRGTPKDVGNGAQLDRVVSVGDGVQYQFTMMAFARSDIDVEEFHDFMYETSRAQICSHPQLVGFFDTEAGFVEYKIGDRDGVFLTKIRFDKSDCE